MESELRFSTEIRKESSVLLLDFGTLFIKATLLTEGDQSAHFHDYVATIRNQVYYISEEKAKRLRADSKDEISIPTGYFTRREIEEQKLLFQADPVYVQIDAVPKNAPILVKAYQNLCEELEKELEINSIVNNYENWSVVVAIAAFETQEAQKDVEKVHEIATKQLGFKSIYINSQIMFDYISQIHYLKTSGLQDGYCFIINIGGGDTEVAAISGVPIMHTFRRFPIAGQEITLYCQKVLQEQLQITGIMLNTIEEWLMEGGTVNEDAPPTIKKFKKRELDIRPLLNAPQLLFDFNKYWAKERRFNSITEIISESIDSLINTTAFSEGIGLILQAVIVVGGAANYRGLTQRLELELKSLYPEFMDSIHVFSGDQPQMSGINGIRQLIRMKYKDQNGLNFTLLNEKYSG